MSRTARLIPLGLVLSLVLGLACGAPARPNVLILIMDTTRADRCSVYGHRKPTTPALGRLASEAVVYDDAWSPSHWTPPAHATLFTGLRPENHGCEPAVNAYLLPTVPTLAELLGGAGYRTGMLSNNPALEFDGGLFRGMDEVGLLYEERESWFPTEPTAPETHASALDWMRTAAADGKPFLLVVNDVEPHLPYTPPLGKNSPFVDRDRADAASMPEISRLAGREALAHTFGGKRMDENTIALLSDLYDGEIASLDDSIGKLLSAMRAEGLLDDTVVVVTADHGEAFDEHGMLEHSAGLYRYLLHVPLIIRYPHARLGGTRVTDPVRLEDVLPTILEVAGIRSPTVDGRSLLSDLPGRIARASSQPAERLLHSWSLRADEVDFARFQRTALSVYDGKHHLIEHSDGLIELFEPGSDPLEQVELSAARPEVVRALRSQLGKLPAPAR